MIDLNISSLIRSHKLRVEERVRAEFLYNSGHNTLYLSQVKLAGLDLPAGAVFMKSARSVNSKKLKIMLNTVFKFTKVAEIVIGKHWKTLSRVLN